MEIEHAVKCDMILTVNVTASQKATWAGAFSGVTTVNFTAAEILIPLEFSVGRVLVE